MIKPLISGFLISSALAVCHIYIDSWQFWLLILTTVLLCMWWGEKS